MTMTMMLILCWWQTPRNPRIIFFPGANTSWAWVLLWANTLVFCHLAAVTLHFGSFPFSEKNNHHLPPKKQLPQQTEMTGDIHTYIYIYIYIYLHVWTYIFSTLDTISSLINHAWIQWFMLMLIFVYPLKKKQNLEILWGGRQQLTQPNSSPIGCPDQVTGIPLAFTFDSFPSCQLGNCSTTHFLRHVRLAWPGGLLYWCMVKNLKISACDALFFFGHVCFFGGWKWKRSTNSRFAALL